MTRMHSTWRFALVAALFVASTAVAQAFSPLERSGRALLQSLCARCHAIDRTGASPHPDAPPFREIDRRLDLDSFVSQLGEGFSSGHPDMPTFHFSRRDARAAVAYLRVIQGP